MNIPILSFNNGRITAKLDSRSDIDKYASSCRFLDNLLPLVYGCAERRPGTKYSATSYGSASIVRMIKFVYSAEISYMIEVGDQYMRIFYSGTLLLDGAAEVVIVTPYIEADIFQLQFQQVGDVMWITHPSYAQRKLTRFSPYGFALNVIPFKKGPFLLRNDLIDPYDVDTSFLTSAVTAAGTSGTLTSSTDLFQPSHVGCLFQLIHPKDTLEVTQSGAGTSAELKAVKGTVHSLSTGRWSGTWHVQRNENDAGWENWRTYTALTGGRNDARAWQENFDNVRYRIYAQPGMSADFGATISTDINYTKGIVEIDSVTSPVSAEVTVISEVESTDNTKKWAEGAWSGVRGYPVSVAFLSDRCIYAGTVLPVDPIDEVSDDYVGISSIAGLKLIDTDAASRALNYELLCDLDLTSETNWTPLCADGTPFTGIFNGKNHLISNLTIDREDSNNQGLFDAITGATIKNLKVEATVKAQGCGGIAWIADGCTLENLYVNLTLESNTTGRLEHCGGIVGQISNTSTLTKCHSIIAFTAHEIGNFLGGLVGSGTGTIFTDCYCSGTISEHADVYDNDDYLYLGGLAGQFGTSAFTNCYSVVAFSANLVDRNNRGGFLGDDQGSLTFADNFWDTEVSGLSNGVDNGNVSDVTGRTTDLMKT